MSNADSNRVHDEDVETALLDVDLFLKYGAPQKAIKRLQTALESQPRSITLRENLREIATANKVPGEAARQCLALASLYIAREDFEAAHDRLLQAKQLDPRISIAPGLDAIRRARRPDLAVPSVPPNTEASGAPAGARRVTLAGDLSTVSIFDAVQVIENSRLTGALAVEADERRGQIHFNEGRIVGADSGDVKGLGAFRRIVEITSGAFDFEKSAEEFSVTINALSNTNLILDTLRQLDEEKA